MSQIHQPQSSLHHDRQIPLVLDGQPSGTIGSAGGLRPVSPDSLRIASNDRPVKVGRGNSNGIRAAFDLPGNLVLLALFDW